MRSTRSAVPVPWQKSHIGAEARLWSMDTATLALRGEGSSVVDGQSHIGTESRLWSMDRATLALRARVSSMDGSAHAV